MSNTLILNQNYIFDGLGTVTYTVPSTGTYNVAVQATFQPGSALSIVVNDNASPIFTAPAPGATQTALQFKFDFLATAADVITVVLSSSAAVDKQYNSVMSNISIGQGL